MLGEFLLATELNLKLSHVLGALNHTENVL